MRIAIINRKRFKMAEFKPESDFSDSRRQAPPHKVPIRDEFPQFAPESRRTEWLTSSRSSSMDSGISELTSIPYDTPSPIIRHSPIRPITKSGDQRHNKSSQLHRHNIAHKHTDGDSSTLMDLSRPSSSFSNFSTLPDIGQQKELGHDNISSSGSKLQPENVQNRTESPKQMFITYNCDTTYDASHSTNLPTSRPISGKKISTRALRQQQFARRKNSQSNMTGVIREPSENEQRILLAIKLPSGERLQRYFHPSDSFVHVCAYAESQSKQSLSNCNMFINQVPKRLIENWKQTFREAGLPDRTLLCLEEND